MLSLFPLCCYPLGILDKLLQEHVDQEETSTLVTENHLACWGYDDGLVQSEQDEKGGFVYMVERSSWD